MQKSKAIWELKGDRNTKFFHILVSSKNNRNALCSINVNGVVKEEPEDIRAEVFQHFRNLFTKLWPKRPSLSGPFKSIGGTEISDALEAEFTKAEIVAAVKNYDGNKAPGPDGFN